MSVEVPRRDYDDEFDLLELLQALWANKFTLLIASVLPLLVSWGVLLTATPTFEVRAAVFIKVEPLSGNDAVAMVMESSGEGWLAVDDEAVLAFTTEAPKSLVEYQNSLEELNLKVRSFMLREAEVMAHVIDNEMDSNSRQTEVVATNQLQAKLLISALQGESMPLAFGPVSISESKRDFLAVSVAAALGGALVGMVFVLLRSAFRDRRLKAAHIER